MSKTEETTLSSKGQLVIPHRIRQELHLKTGTTLLVRACDNRILLIPKPKDAYQALVDLGKRLKLKGATEALLADRRAEGARDFA